MERSVAKIRKSGKSLVVNMSANILEEAGYDLGDTLVIGAVRGKIVLLPLNPDGIAEALGVAAAEEEEEEEQETAVA